SRARKRSARSASVNESSVVSTLSWSARHRGWATQFSSWPFVSLRHSTGSSEPSSSDTTWRIEIALGSCARTTPPRAPRLERTSPPRRSLARSCSRYLAGRRSACATVRTLIGPSPYRAARYARARTPYWPRLLTRMSISRGAGRFLFLTLSGDLDDFLHQGVHDLVFLHLADDLAAAHEQTHADAARDAHIRVARFPRAVHLATHHGDAKRDAQLERLHFLFDLRGE